MYTFLLFVCHELRVVDISSHMLMTASTYVDVSRKSNICANISGLWMTTVEMRKRTVTMQLEYCTSLLSHTKHEDIELALWQVVPRLAFAHANVFFEAP